MSPQFDKPKKSKQKQQVHVDNYIDDFEGESVKKSSDSSTN